LEKKKRKSLKILKRFTAEDIQESEKHLFFDPTYSIESSGFVD